MLTNIIISFLKAFNWLCGENTFNKTPSTWISQFFLILFSRPSRSMNAPFLYANSLFIEFTFHIPHSTLINDYFSSPLTTKVCSFSLVYMYHINTLHLTIKTLSIYTKIHRTFDPIPPTLTHSNWNPPNP